MLFIIQISRTQKQSGSSIISASPPTPSTKTKTLTEGGSVYNEEQTEQGEESCYHDLDKRVLGKENPLAANIGGAPDQMRSVTPHDIREFHRGHYRLGPTTGFIFAIHPKEDVLAFLQKVSGEFGRLPQGRTRNSALKLLPGAPSIPYIPQKILGLKSVPFREQTKTLRRIFGLPGDQKWSIP